MGSSLSRFRVRFGDITILLAGEQSVSEDLHSMHLPASASFILWILASSTFYFSLLLLEYSQPVIRSLVTRGQF